MTTVHERITRARAAMLIERPFFGALALRLKVEEAPWLKHDMAVDGKTLYFNRERVNALPMDELKVTLIHEVIHCALGHPWRRGNRDPDRWNDACDFAANILVRDAGEKLWDVALIDDAYKDDPAERIYTKRTPPKSEGGGGNDDADAVPDDNDQHPGDGGNSGPSEAEDDTGDESNPDASESGSDDGSGDGDTDGQGDDGASSGDDVPRAGDGDGEHGQGRPDDGEGGSGGTDEDSGGQSQLKAPDGRPLPSSSGGGGRGAVIDAPPDAAGKEPTEADRKAQEQDWKLATAQAAQMASAAGNLPGCFKSFVHDVLQPKAPWQQLLREFMQTPCKDDYSWARPNRRHIAQGLYLPSARSDRVGTFVLFVDTSGSISDEILGQFNSEMNEILQVVRPVRLVVVQCDSEVHEDGVKEYAPDDYPIELEAYGRGGTLFQPAFDWVEENLDEVPVCAAYLTDMAPCDVPQDPGYPVLWMDYDGGFMPDMPFGERINIE